MKDNQKEEFKKLNKEQVDQKFIKVIILLLFVILCIIALFKLLLIKQKICEEVPKVLIKTKVYPNPEEVRQATEKYLKKNYSEFYVSNGGKKQFKFYYEKNIRTNVRC